MENDEKLLDILKSCDGYYASPRASGKIIGPLVAYAGKYKAGDGIEKQYVGPVYFNFAKAEQHPDVCRSFAYEIIKNMIGTNLQASYYNDPLFRADIINKFMNERSTTPTVIIGMPMGGIILATHIGTELGCRTIFAEKKVIALADPQNGIKETSELIIDRHEIKPYDRVFIVEDVCNNFSTTEKAAGIISKAGAKFLGILCAINRSAQNQWHESIVISAIFCPSEQYKQDDPAVATLVECGQIVWKPKQEWSILRTAMETGG